MFLNIHHDFVDLYFFLMMFVNLHLDNGRAGAIHSDLERFVMRSTSDFFVSALNFCSSLS